MKSLSESPFASRHPGSSLRAGKVALGAIPSASTAHCPQMIGRWARDFPIDEAHLLRLDVFDQLHTVAQADFDSRTLVPIVFSGQIALIDKLLFHTSRPFASRVVGRSHMEALQRDHMADYLAHHVAIAGGTTPLFGADAVTAIHQSSGGMLRRAGNLARGALMAAAIEGCPIATAEHVRIASTEIL